MRYEVYASCDAKCYTEVVFASGSRRDALRVFRKLVRQNKADLTASNSATRNDARGRDFSVLDTVEDEWIAAAGPF